MNKKAGFTLVELLIVISVIAIIATLATGAAVKAVKMGRARRADTTATVLKMALENYHTKVGSWPFTRPSSRRTGNFRKATYSGANAEYSDSSRIDNVYFLHGSKNSALGDVWATLYREGYLDGSGLLAVYKGTRKRVHTIPKTSVSGKLEIGYPTPADGSKFAFYCLIYNGNTDSVDVERQDLNGAGYAHKCSGYNKNN